MFLKAHRDGWRVAEVPVDYAPRLGKSKVTGTLRGTVTALKDMGTQLAAASQRTQATKGDGPADRAPADPHGATP
ncbi:uncharacterized glycosyltransferase Mb0553 [Arthrobacter sp. Hiyo8]|nr:uncharacterized glycosyltransferase Mb0553 [Arthrobacter sp. Hiyo8]